VEIGDTKTRGKKIILSCNSGIEIPGIIDDKNIAFPFYYSLHHYSLRDADSTLSLKAGAKITWQN
jgi:hypothetical protein